MSGLQRVLSVSAASMIFFIVILLANLSISYGQKSKAGFERSILSKHADILKQTLTLKLDAKRRMVLDRKAWEVNAMTEDERKAAIRKRYAGRGIPDEHIDRMVESQIRHGAGPLSETIIRFVEASNDGRSRGRSSSGTNMTWRNGNSHVSINDIEGTQLIQINELEGSFANLNIRDDGKSMNIAFSNETSTWQVRQTKGGKIVASIICGDEAMVLSGTDWNNLLEANPGTGRLLTELMTHIGIELPPTPNDPRVISEALLELRSYYGGTEDAFAQFLKKLDSDDFAERENAKERLSEQYEDFKAFIDVVLEQKRGSIQQRSVLTSLKKEKAESEKYARYADYLKAEKLLMNPTFLISLFDHTDSSTKPMLIRRLKEVTEQEFGEDVDAWKAFVHGK